jgi:hypothetical protein
MEPDREWLDYRGVKVAVGDTVAHYQTDKRVARQGVIIGTRDFPPRILVEWGEGSVSCVKPKNVMVLHSQPEAADT